MDKWKSEWILAKSRNLKYLAWSVEIIGLAEARRKEQDWEVIRSVEPYVRRSGASLQERWWGWCELILGDSALHEPWRYAPWHLESSAHSSPCVERWDNAQPTVRYLTWPISGRPGARALPLRSHVSTSLLVLSGVVAPYNTWAPLLSTMRVLDLCQCFSRRADHVLLPPFFWSRTSVKPAPKWRLFHTVTTFVSYHTLYLLSESRLVFPFPHVVNQRQPDHQIWLVGFVELQHLYSLNKAVYILPVLFTPNSSVLAVITRSRLMYKFTPEHAAGWKQTYTKSFPVLRTRFDQVWLKTWNK